MGEAEHYMYVHGTEVDRQWVAWSPGQLRHDQEDRLAVEYE